MLMVNGGPACDPQDLKDAEWERVAPLLPGNAGDPGRSGLGTGLFDRLFRALSGDPGFEYALIDGTIIPVHQHGMGAKGGLCSDHRPLARRPDHQDRGPGGCARQSGALLLLQGLRLNSVGAEPLLDGIELGALIADKRFDNDALGMELDARGATAMILPKADRVRQIACDYAMYYWRYLVENFFCALKWFRRVATRCDKTDQSFSAMICLVASFMDLK
jgi:transposase